jgi:hypothetical protein
MGKRELQHLLDALGLANYNKMREYIRMEEILTREVMDKRLYMLDTVTLYDCELISRLCSFYEEISFKGMAAGLSIQNVHISKNSPINHPRCN